MRSSTYEGTFKNDEKDGNGVITFEDGTRF